MDAKEYADAWDRFQASWYGREQVRSMCMRIGLDFDRDEIQAVFKVGFGLGYCMAKGEKLPGETPETPV